MPLANEFPELCIKSFSWVAKNPEQQAVRIESAYVMFEISWN